jgi:4-hydroxybenzoate polyprenyltransferase
MMKSPAGTVPLCVDLDGTLILTDSLLESLVKLLKVRPLYLLFFPLWLLSGRAELKRKVAQLVTLDTTSLPYRSKLVAFLKAENKRGRTLVLATAADEKIAQGIADHFGFFSKIVASDGKRNLKGGQKAAALEQLYGPLGFDYVANSLADIPVWAKAQQALAVGISPGLLRRIRRSVPVEEMFGPTNISWTKVAKLFRVQHWAKNILIFSPLLLSHQIQDLTAWSQSTVTFVAFSLVASAVYVINDMLDIETDRYHASKQDRPFASGTVPLGLGMVIAPVLIFIAFVIGSTVQPQVDLLLIVYVCLNLAYTLRLKRVLFLDVLLLPSFYVLRIFIGSVATDIPISPWFMVLSLFLFLSLALVKRISELIELKEENMESTGRCYLPGDKELLLNFGATSGYLSVLVFALYLNGSDVQSLYEYPNILWGICPILLYWLSRLWLLAGRGEVTYDPIIFAFKDKVSFLTALLAVAIWCAAWGLLPLPIVE